MSLYISNSLEETNKIAGKLLDDLHDRSRDLTSATIVGLSGHLGAGKTAFVKCVADHLGVAEEITSPTFVIMKIYKIDRKDEKWKRLVHIDAYRLERTEDLAVLGLDQISSDHDNLIMIEWPENVSLIGDKLSCSIGFKISDGKYVISTEPIR